ncbi:MAG: hypothetical protein NMNS01_27020 [Nitrosomonas sp.]|nr:MAG: hypothetical protein NMNS01_27020 [Nitrosomonas sp.]
MSLKPHLRKTNHIASRYLIVTLGLMLISGCLSPIALHKAVVSYNRSINEIVAHELLLNIARVRHRHPVKFTAVSSIAATFNFQMSAGATPPLGALTGGQGLAPVFGGSVSENPTITIIPLDGEEFNQRVLTPFSEVKFFQLYQKGTDIGLLIRLMASELRADKTGKQEILQNRPMHGTGYKEFRRQVLHLTALDQSQDLYIQPIVVEQIITLPAKSMESSESVINAMEMGYRWIENGDKGTLIRDVVGRTVISNYEITILSEEERNDLYLYTNTLPENDIFVDIRPGHEGGEYPFRGVIRLRPFLAMLGFLALGITEEVEYLVKKDERSGSVRHNPVKTMDVIETSNTQKNAAFSINYEGKVYSILSGEDPQAVWNREAFSLLNQLYELSVDPTEFARPAPVITISK